MNTKTDSTGAQANWFVGASYGGTDDQMPRFLAEGIWENGYGDKLLDVVRSMRPGERIAIMLIHFQSWAISGRIHVEI